MSNLIPIEHNGQRVLLTQQLAESYGTDTNSVVKNFNNNKDRYRVGKHYYLLEGDELRFFKSEVKKIGYRAKRQSAISLAGKRRLASREVVEYG